MVHVVLLMVASCCYSTVLGLSVSSTSVVLRPFFKQLQTKKKQISDLWIFHRRKAPH